MRDELKTGISASAEALRNEGVVTTQTIIPIRLVIRMTKCAASGGRLRDCNPSGLINLTGM